MLITITVKCEYPLNFLPVVDGLIILINFSEPALAGTNATIKCLSVEGDSEQTAINNTFTITCMDDGRWEPELPQDGCIHIDQGKDCIDGISE